MFDVRLPAVKGDFNPILCVDSTRARMVCLSARLQIDLQFSGFHAREDGLKGDKLRVIPIRGGFHTREDSLGVPKDK